MATLFSDNFNRADSGDLGANWTDWEGVGANKAGIRSNAFCNYDFATNAGVVSAYDNTVISSGNYTLSVDLEYQQTGAVADYWVEPYMRDQSTSGSKFSDLYFLYVQNYPSPSARVEVYLLKRVSGSQSQIGSTYTNNTPPSAGNHTYKISGNGTTLKAYMDGVERISGTDSSFSTEGKHGIRTATNGTTNAFFVDNYLLEDFNAGGGGLLPRLTLLGAG